MPNPPAISTAPRGTRAAASAAVMIGTVFIRPQAEIVQGPTARSSSLLLATTAFRARALSRPRLHNRRLALAHANAKGRESVPDATSLPHRVHERGHEPRARAAQRMTEGNRATIHVRDVVPQ